MLSATWYLVRHDDEPFVLSLVLNDKRHHPDGARAVAIAEAGIGLLAKAG